jgi:MFS family permease
MMMARSRGAVAGPLLMLLGAWGALIPFFGHSFGYGFTPNDTWHWTAARGWMEVAPGAGAFVGGAVITYSAHRATAMLGGWLAAASGAWFVLGAIFAPWWNAGFLGAPTGNTTHVILERVGMFSGLGALIVLIAGTAIGRFSVVGVRDVAVAQRRLDAMKTIEDAPVLPDETRHEAPSRDRELHETSH